MVSSEGFELVDNFISCHLKILENTNSKPQDLTDTYIALAGHLVEQTDEAWNGTYKKTLLKSIKRDLQTESVLCQAVLHFLEHLLKGNNISLTVECTESLLDCVVQLLLESKDKGVLGKALICLNGQQFPSIISKKIQQIMCGLEKMLLTKSLKSSSLEKEGLLLISKLLEQCHDEMEIALESWIKIVYPFVISNLQQVAELSLQILKKELPMLCRNTTTVTKYLVPDLSMGLINELKKKFEDNNEKFVLDVWACFVSILGQLMYKGGQLTNNLLKITESAFKSTSIYVQAYSFQVWKSLIENYASSPVLAETPKRLKLLLMPLMFPLFKTRHDIVEQSRFDTWWHLICRLDSSVYKCFDSVVVPFLHLCFKVKESVTHGTNTPRHPKTPEKSSVIQEGFTNSLLQSPSVILAYFDKTPKSTSSISPNLNMKFDEITRKGSRALLQLLGRDSQGSPLSNEHQIDAFNGGRMPVNVFQTHCHIIFAAVENIFKARAVPETLSFSIWMALIDLVNLTLEEEKNDLQNVCLGGLLLLLQTLSNDTAITASRFLSMVDYCYFKLHDVVTTFKEVLKTEENTSGLFPVILIGLMTNTRLMKENIFLLESFRSFLEMLMQDTLNGGVNQLSYVLSLMTFVENTHSLINDKDSLVEIWSVVAQKLTEFIIRTSDVNQGDGLSYNFDCITTVLMLPIKYLLSANLREASLNAVTKTWMELYKAFDVGARLVPAADINPAASEICCNLVYLLEDTKKKDYKKGMFIKRVVDIMEIITQEIKFDNVSKPDSLLSPRKLARVLGQTNKKEMSIFKVTALLLQNALLSDGMDQRGHDALLLQCFQSMEFILTSISTSDFMKSFIRIISPVVKQFLKNEGNSSEKGSSVHATDEKRTQAIKVTKKVISFTESLFQCVEKVCKGCYNNELLQSMTELLEAALKSNRKELRRNAIRFWNATFGQCPIGVEYSDALKNILDALSDVVKIPAEQDEELTQFPDSSNSIPASPKLKSPRGVIHSPHRIRGSFMNLLKNGHDDNKRNSTKQALFASPTKSPVKAGVLSPRSVHRKALRLDDDASCEFVKIESPQKKNRPLTDHQKEVMLMKRNIPALYNELDQSQDSTLFSILTQESSMRSQPEPVGEVRLPNKAFSQKQDTAECLSSREDIACNTSAIKNAISKDDVDSNGCIPDKDDVMSPTNKQRESKTSHNLSCEESRIPLCNSNTSEPLTSDKSKGTGDVTRTECNQTSPGIIPSSQSQSESPIVIDSVDVKFANEKQEHVDISKDPSRPAKKLFDEAAESSIGDNGKDTDGNMCLRLKTDTAPSASKSVGWSQVLVEDTENYSCPLNIPGELEATFDVVEAQNTLASTQDENKNETSEVIPCLQNTEKAKSDGIEIISDNMQRQNVEALSSSRPESILSEINEDTCKDEPPQVPCPYEVPDDSPETKASPISTRTRPKKPTTRKNVTNLENAPDLRTSKVRSETSKPGSNSTRDSRTPKRHVHFQLEVTERTLSPKTEDRNITSPVSERSMRRRVRRATPYTQRKRRRVSNQIQFESLPNAVEEKEKHGSKDNSKEQASELPLEQIVKVESNEKPGIDENAKNFVKVEAQNLVPSNQGQSLENILVKNSDSENALPAKPVFSQALRTQNLKSLVSPGTSPVSGILKKRVAGKKDTPSPPNKVRRVSFALPPEKSTSDGKDDENELARPLSECEVDKTGKTSLQYTAIKAKQRLNSKGQSNGPAICPDLVSCTAPIEQILPTLTPTALSRGLGHLVRAQNILTVGNLSALSEIQIQSLPIRSPKVTVVKEALRLYQSHAKKNERHRKGDHDEGMNKAKGEPSGKPRDEGKEAELSTTPPKLSSVETENVPAANIPTPSRSGKETRRVSLFEGTTQQEKTSENEVALVKVSEPLAFPVVNSLTVVDASDFSKDGKVTEETLTCNEQLDYPEAAYTQESNSPDTSDNDILSVNSRGAFAKDKMRVEENLVEVHFPIRVCARSHLNMSEEVSENVTNNIETNIAEKTKNMAAIEKGPEKQVFKSIDLLNDDFDKKNLIAMSVNELFLLQEKVQDLTTKVVAALKHKCMLE